MKLAPTIKVLVLALLIAPYLNAQVGIGTTDPKSLLDIPASNITSPSNTDGILIPRVNDFPAVDPGRDQNGMMIFLQTAVGLDSKGFYYWDWPNVTWVSIGAEEWQAGTNSTGDNLIYATRAKLTGTDVVITDDGRIGFGTSDPIERFEFKGPGDNDFQITSANTNPPNVIVYNTGGTLASPGPLATNGEIGSFIAKTHDGNGVREVGGVRFYMDGVATAGSTPSRFVVNTTPLGTTGQVERFIIRNDGKTGIGTPDPTQLLDVDGDVRVRTLSAGAVFSDASGNLSNIAIGPTIVAAGKVDSSGGADKITGATVSRLSTGTYRVTYNNSQSSNCVIQVSIDNCSGCSGDDSINIYYDNQTSDRFDVIIGSNDNGTGSNKTPRDREFMFTVLDF